MPITYHIKNKNSIVFIKKDTYVLDNVKAIFYNFDMKLETFSKLIADSFIDKKSIPLFVKDNFNDDEKTQKSIIRSIRRYVDGTVIPSYEKARELVDKLNIIINEQELMEVLEYSKTEKDLDVRYREPRCIVDLNIKYSELFKGRNLSISDKDRMLISRIESVCSKKSIKEYIIKLIENDLENGVLTNNE